MANKDYEVLMSLSFTVRASTRREAEEPAEKIEEAITVGRLWQEKYPTWYNDDCRKNIIYVRQRHKR